MVETPIGFRCPTCAGLAGRFGGDLPLSLLLRVVVAGLAVTLVVGWLWSRIPDWQFYLSLLLGFGVTEAMAWVAQYRRSPLLQFLGLSVVLVGLLFSRVLLLQALGVTGGALLERLGDLRFWGLVQLQPIPDLLFAVLACIIPVIRFRMGR